MKRSRRASAKRSTKRYAMKLVKSRRSRSKARRGSKREPTFYACFTNPGPAGYGKIPHGFFKMNRKPLPHGGVVTTQGAHLKTCDQFGYDSTGTHNWTDADFDKFWTKKRAAMKHVEKVLKRTKKPSEFYVQSN